MPANILMTYERERRQAFNDELDGMFNDANLPEGEAWAAMSKDLRKSKEDRNALARENA